MLEDRQGRRNVDSRGKQVDGRAADRIVEARMDPNRLQFGAEQEVAADPAVIKRLLAEAVAGEMEDPLLTVPKGDGEHSDALFQRRAKPPFGDRLEQGLRIGMAAPGGQPPPLERRAQLFVVVDFAIVGEHPAAVVRDHRLVALRRQVDDRKSAVAEPDSGLVVDPASLIVRPAMGDRVRHRRHRLRVDRAPGKQAGYAAHFCFPSLAKVMVEPSGSLCGATKAL
jgi:hypothetical protein